MISFFIITAQLFQIQLRSLLDLEDQSPAALIRLYSTTVTARVLTNWK
jgi:hypothetical protein